jgi:cation transport ATPase
MDITINELKRLKFEDFIWLLFAFLCFINIYGDDLQKKYLNTNDPNLEIKSNEVFLFTLIVTFFIYLYFFIRNYNALKNASFDTKSLYIVKILGSSFLLAGVICLIYFQKKNQSFIGSPGL